LANIAGISYRTGGAGWIQIDGGCDQAVYDILIVGGTMYVTGAFSYCGLNSEGFTQNNGQFHGRVPTSAIAAIDLTLNPSVQSWRPLGIGLQGGPGYALAFRGGFLYVGGTFTSAGGALYTQGIARWNSNQWSNVLTACGGPCDRAVNVIPYIGLSPVPDPSVRKPANCYALSSIQGNIYCIDNSNFLAWWDGNQWHRAGTLTVDVNSPGFPTQNSLIVNNGSSSSSNVLVPGLQNVGANSLNFFSWNTQTQNYEPSFGGFSVCPTAMAAGSVVLVSQLLAFILLIAFVFLF